MKGAMDSCLWCCDYRHRHYDGGCGTCGFYPWDRGIYACNGFVETQAELNAREALIEADFFHAD